MVTGLLIAGGCGMFLLIAVGILAAIMLPSIERINQAAEANAARRDAMQLASVATAAKAAGYDFVASSHTQDVSSIVAKVVVGGIVSETTSPFYNQLFAVPHLDREAQHAACAHLSLINGELRYTPDRTSSSPTQAAPGPAPVAAPSPGTALLPARGLPAPPVNSPDVPEEVRAFVEANGLGPVDAAKVQQIVKLKQALEALQAQQAYCPPIEIRADAPTWDAVVRQPRMRQLRETLELEQITEPRLRDFANFLIQVHSATTTPTRTRLQPAALEAIEKSDRYPVLAYHSMIFLDERQVPVDKLLPNLEKHGDLLHIFHARCLRASFTQQSADIDLALAGLKKLLDETNGLKGLLPHDALYVCQDPVYCSHFFYKHHQQVSDAVCAHPKVAGWLKDFVEGDHHILAAWESRTSRVAAKVTPEGWRGFTSHLRQARRCLTRSWEAHPHPLVATKMITVAMGDSPNPPAEMRLWFDRAIGERADYSRAYSAYLCGIEPKWHGSDAALAAFGKACLETKRFDLDVPNFLLSAHTSKSNFGEGYWSKLTPKELSDLDTLFHGYENSPSRDVEARKEDRSTAAVIWFACGRDDKMQAYLKLLDFDVDPAPIKTYRVSKSRFEAKVAECRKRHQKTIQQTQ